MRTTLLPPTLLAALAVGSTALAAGGSAVDGLLARYASEGAGAPDAARGAALWAAPHPAPDGGPARSCTSCHPADHARPGQHARTGEDIAPLSPAVNAERLTDPAEVEKWFGRNCKWVLGRACTPQEKADLLVFIAGRE